MRARRLRQAALAVEVLVFFASFVTFAVIGSTELTGTRLVHLRRLIEFELIGACPNCPKTTLPDKSTGNEYTVHAPATFNDIRDVDGFELYVTGLLAPMAGEYTRLLPDQDVSVSSDLQIQFKTEHPTVKTYAQERLQGWSVRQVRKTPAFASEYEAATVATTPPSTWPGQFPTSLQVAGAPNPFEYTAATDVDGQGQFAPFDGLADTYPGGGFVHTIRGNPYNESDSTLVEDQFEYLLSRDWVDSETMAVFVDTCVALYYGGEDLQAASALTSDEVCVRLLFEFGEFGDVTATYYIRAADAAVVTGPLQTAFATFSLLFAALELALLAVSAVTSAGPPLQRLRDYCVGHETAAWKLVDLAVMALCMYGWALDVGGGTGLQSTDRDLQASTDMRRVYAWIMCLTVLQVIKFLSWMPLLHLPVLAIAHSALNVVSFLVVVGVANCALAALAFFYFGALFEDFRTYGRSLLTLLQAMLGDFGFDRFEGTQYEVAGVLAMAAYGCVMSFTLLTMLVVIVEKGFVQAEREARKAQKDLIQTLRRDLGFVVPGWGSVVPTPSPGAVPAPSGVDRQELNAVVMRAIDSYMSGVSERSSGRGSEA